MNKQSKQTTFPTVRGAVEVATGPLLDFAGALIAVDAEAGLTGLAAAPAFVTGTATGLEIGTPAFSAFSVAIIEAAAALVSSEFSSIDGISAAEAYTQG